MPPATLAAWLDWIERSHPREIELGLERVAAVYSRLHLPPPPPVVTVAGTNGKGSLVALAEAILGAAGYRVGAYTSPHLQRFNERVRLAGAEVDDATLCAAFARVEAARDGVALTYFEFATLAACTCFADAGLDAWVLEVGLGGRLDAVNVIAADVALFGPIAIDHVEWLGGDRETIGREKAGIMRPGRPAVSVEAAPPASLVAHAAALGAPLLLPGRDYDFAIDAHGWRWESSRRRRASLPRPALAGGHQYGNAAAVLAALERLESCLPIDQAAVRDGLRDVAVQGRFEVLPGPVETILDVAHNPHATAALAATLAARPCKGRTLGVIAMLDDKAIEEALAPLLDPVDAWFVAALPGPRGSDGSRLQRVAAAAGRPVSRHADVAAALAAAEAAAVDGDRVLVCGSFVTVGEALSRYNPRAGHP